MSTKAVVHVAYADDHPIVREGIVSLISRHENIVVDIAAENGKELLEKIEKAQQRPQICILDINMPVMDGFETIIELKKRWPEIGILVFTVFKNEWQLIRMVTYGANGYLSKNSNLSELSKAILAINESGVYYPDKETMLLLKAVRSNHVTLPKITAMEMEFLKLSCSELTYQEIAARLNTSLPSIDGFRASLFRKLNVNSRVGLAIFAIQFGIAPLEISDGPLV